MFLRKKRFKADFIICFDGNNPEPVVYDTLSKTIKSIHGSMAEAEKEERFLNLQNKHGKLRRKSLDQVIKEVGERYASN